MSPDWVRLNAVAARLKELKSRAESVQVADQSPLAALLYSEIAELEAEREKLVGRMLDSTARMEAGREALTAAFATEFAGSAKSGAIQCPLLRELMVYWESLRSGDELPRKRDFNPLNLSVEVWPRLFLIDIADTMDFRIRLLGTYVIAGLGQDFTGHRIADDDTPGASQSMAYRLLRELYAKQAPQHYVGPPKFGKTKRFNKCEQIYLPLIDDPGQICAAVGAIDYPDADLG
jgi:hypothetical protein